MGTLDRAPRRSRDERGVVLPTPVALASVVLVAAAGLYFVSSDGGEPQQATTVAAPARTPGPRPTTDAPAPRPQRVVSAKALEKKKREPVDRGAVYLEIYNNSNVTGLAGETTSRASAYGWQVVATDNWYGTIPSSTIYYPDRLYRAAKLLSSDLGISRVKPAIDPMSRDRLTVVLTSDFTG